MFFQPFLETGSYNERLNLFRHIENRKPIKALNNPDYEHKLRSMLLAGKSPEEFRNRNRISDGHPSEMRSYSLAGKNSTERRLFDRFASTGLMTHFIGPSFELESTRSIDISLGGISVCIPHEYELSLGDTVGLALQQGDQTVLISGAVANTRPAREGQVFGIKFEPSQVIEQEQEIKSLIKECIQERKHGADHRSSVAA